MDTVTKMHVNPLHRPVRRSFKSFVAPCQTVKHSTYRIRSSLIDLKIAPIIKTTCLTIVTSAAIIFNCHLVVPVYAAPTHRPTLSMEETGNVEEEGLVADEKLLEDHLSRNPNDIEALRLLMEVRVKLMKLLEAVAVLNRLIDLEPEEEEWPLMKAQIYSFNGDMDSARKGFGEILDKNPFKVECYHGLLMVESDSGNRLGLVRERIERAMDKCTNERASQLRDFKLLVAQVSIMEGRYVEALRLYEELVKEEPRDFRPYLCQGIIHSLMRDKDAAEKNFEQFKKFVPKDHPYRDYFFDNMFATKLFLDKLERDPVVSGSEVA